jgi:hypothetical protein
MIYNAHTLHRGIENLLDLDGSILGQENAHWVKIDVWRVEPTPEIPHGIRYALTLHRKDGTRVMGYDNAHAVGPANRFQHRGRIVPYDHRHRHIADRGIPYNFRDGYQLLSDFFADVDRIIEETKESET